MKKLENYELLSKITVIKQIFKNVQDNKSKKKTKKLIKVIEIWLNFKIKKFNLIQFKYY